MKTFITLCFFLAMILTLSSIEAHEVRPAYLQLTQLTNTDLASDDEIFEILWKQPLRNGKKLRLTPSFPERCTILTNGLDEVIPGALIKNWKISCKTDAFLEQSVFIDGLASTLTDVLLMVNWLNGENTSIVLTASKPLVLLNQHKQTKFSGYFNLGLTHLLSGFDHILFILVLLFFTTGFSSLIKTITAFTLAHSVTLAISTLNIVQLSQAPVEAAIALSILYLAYEASSTDKQASIAFRMPWRVAFIFGLLHGFGFSSALVDIGLPDNAVVGALLFFNLGVEFGQIIVISILLSSIYLITKWFQQIPQWLVQAPIFVVGIVSSYWLFQQLAVIIGV